MNPTKVDRNIILKKLNLDENIYNKDNNQNKKETKSKVIEMLNEPEIVHKRQHPIKNIDQLNINSKALLPEKSVSLKNYIYKVNDVLNKKEIEKKVTNKLIHICIYKIIEYEDTIPFILYLLNKDIKSNILYFPHLYTSKNVYTETKNHLINIFKEINTEIILKGYIEDSNNFYIFYETKYKYSLIQQSYNDIWWWVSMFEIINTKMILNFSIDNSVSKIFYKYPLLMVLFDEKNNKLECPYIGYYGGYYTYISFISVFGLPKQKEDANLGPYYYFFTYKGAGRGAIWTSTRKPEMMNGVDITRNQYGVHKRGGIVRFIIFSKKMKYLLNREVDKEDDSKITQSLINSKDKNIESLSKFVKSTAKVRDVDGNWTDNHDITYVGSVLIKSEKYKDRKLDIQFAIKDYNQQLPMTYHYVDTTNFTQIEDEETNRMLPYEYTDYDIE